MDLAFLVPDCSSKNTFAILSPHKCGIALEPIGPFGLLLGHAREVYPVCE